MSWIRKRLTFANVIALVALFLALGNGIVLAGTQSLPKGKIVGYARVQVDGSVVESRSLNVTDANVTLESTAAYCFRDLPFTFKGAQVTVDYAGIASGDTEQAQFARGNPYGDCDGPGVQAEVATSNGTSFEPQPFYVVFYK